MKISLTLNNRPKTFDVAPDEYLVDTLRRYGYTSVRRGCDTTSCGVCTLLVDDKPVPSCAFLSARADGARLTTVEGIPETASKLAEHFGERGADQCGFCNPGIALAVHSMEQSGMPADDATIDHYLVGNLCRCTGYQSQREAIKAYLGDKK